MVNDAKYERLSEIVEDIDNIVRTLRMCCTQEEIDLVEAQENSGFIDITHLISINRTRVQGLK